MAGYSYIYYSDLEQKSSLKSKRFIAVSLILLTLTGLTLLGFTFSKSEQADPLLDRALLNRGNQEPLQVNSVVRDREIGRLSHILQDFPGKKIYFDPDEMASSLFDACNEYYIDPLLIIAMIETESSFYSRIHSSKDAVGLMQLRLSTGGPLAKELIAQGKITTWKGVWSLYNPYKNVLLGTYYTHKLIKRFDDINAALVAYNYGPTHVSNLLQSNKPLPQEFPEHVLRNYKRLLDKYALP
jgi:Transglycosylase SLT domain